MNLIMNSNYKNQIFTIWNQILREIVLIFYVFEMHLDLNLNL